TNSPEGKSMPPTELREQEHDLLEGGGGLGLAGGLGHTNTHTQTHTHTHTHSHRQKHSQTHRHTQTHTDTHGCQLTLLVVAGLHVTLDVALQVAPELGRGGERGEVGGPCLRA